MIAKLSWRLMTNPNSLCASLCVDGISLSNTSCLWVQEELISQIESYSIRSGSKLMGDLIKRVGDGTSLEYGVTMD